MIDLLVALERFTASGSRATAFCTREPREEDPVPQPTLKLQKNCCAALSSLTLDFGGGTNWSAGQSAGTLLFASSNGDRVRVGPIICWDLLYGSTTAESARNGAKFLAAVTNEGWWGKSITAHEIESFTRLRSIETRRSIAKCSNTGYTFFTDPYGRVYGKVRWWEEQIATAGVTLSQEASIYMRYTDYFPRACLFVVGIGLFITLIANHIKPLYLGNA